MYRLWLFVSATNYEFSPTSTIRFALFVQTCIVAYRTKVKFLRIFCVSQWTEPEWDRSVVAFEHSVLWLNNSPYIGFASYLSILVPSRLFHTASSLIQSCNRCLSVCKFNLRLARRKARETLIEGSSIERRVERLEMEWKGERRRRVSTSLKHGR